MSEATVRDPDVRVLMVAYQAGELAAFDKLYALLAPKLRGYLSSLNLEPVAGRRPSGLLSRGLPLRPKVAGYSSET